MNDHLFDLTDELEKVPDPGEDHVERALRNLFSEAQSLYEKDQERHVEPTALVEYLLVVAQRVLDVRDDCKAEVPSQEIKRQLSRGALSALKGKGGVSGCHVSRDMLTRESQKTTYYDEQTGERKFSNCGATIYDPGVLTTNAYKLCSSRLEAGPAQWAEAAEAPVVNDDSSSLDELKNLPLVKKAPALAIAGQARGLARGLARGHAWVQARGLARGLARSRVQGKPPRRM